jgi:hypothetical protein
MVMNLQTENQIADVQIQEKDLYRIDEIEPMTTIVCKKGLVWLTQSGDNNDHVLTDGEKFTLDRRGVVLLEALPYAQVSIIPPSLN